jgi:hypothetical protein
MATACSNTVVEQLGDAGPVDGGGDEGSEGEGEGECPNADEPALSVRVVAASTGLPLCSEVTVTVVDGAFTTTATPTSATGDCRHLGATGRPGTYSVTAAGAGFTSVTLDRLVVEADDCGNPVSAREVSITLPTG